MAKENNVNDSDNPLFGRDIDLWAEKTLRLVMLDTKGLHGINCKIGVTFCVRRKTPPECHVVPMQLHQVKK